MGRLKVTILGTSPPLATLKAGNAGTGLLVSDAGAHVLIDCGPGVTGRIDQAGVDVRAIDTVLLTHHHWDHIADLPHLVLGRWEAGLFGSIGGKPFPTPLRILGPVGTDAVVKGLFGPAGVFAGDIATRLAPEIGVALYTARGVKLPFPPILPEVTEIEPGAECALGPFRLATAEAHHCEPYLRSLAYRLDASRMTIVFSGDASYSPGVEHLARGADLLLHDCNVRIVRETLTRREIHATPAEVGRIATAAGVRHLVVVHHGLPADDLAGRRRLTEMLRENYAGKISVASAGDVVAL